MMKTSFLRLRGALAVFVLQLLLPTLALAGPTTTTLTATPNPVYVQQNLTLTATVSGSSPTGSVTFYDGSTSLAVVPLSAGQASTTFKYQSSGTHTLSASYGGDAANDTSASPSVTLTVAAKVQTRPTLSVSPSPANAGQGVTLTASVANLSSGPTPTGTIAFKDGTTVLQTVALNASATASLTTSFTTTGTHSLVASYSGDTAHASSNGSASLSVNPGALQPTTTTLSASPSPVNVGRPVTLTVTVSGTNLGGDVSVSEAGQLLGQVPISGNSATIAIPAGFATAGVHTLTARYGGDASHDQSSTTLSLSVVPYPTLDFEYDAQGNLTKVTEAKDSLNFATRHHYDLLDRRDTTTDARSKTAQFQHDGQDQLTRVTDPRSLATAYERNGLGHTPQVTSPDTGVTTQTFDSAGNLKTRSDARGVLATYDWDALNRLKGVTYTQAGQSQAFTWSYDQTGSGFAFGQGRLTSTAHPTGSSQFQYDALGRVTSAIQRVKSASGANASQIGTTTTWQYDAAGHVIRLYYPSGTKVEFTYTAGQLSGVSIARNSASTLAPILTDVQHEPFGPVRSWNWAMAAGPQAHTRAFDQAGRMVSYPLGSLTRDIGYDAAARISGYRHSTNNGTPQPSWDQGFGYDELGRLTGFTLAQTAATLAYDDNGNRSGISQNGSARGYTIEVASNRLTGISNPARSITYDPIGNSKTDGAATFAYDLAGRLATHTAGTTVTTYSYDNDGRRIRKFSSTGVASTVIFVYGQDGELLGEYDSTGKAIREYVWMGSTPIAVFTVDPANTNAAPIVYYIHADHIDTPRVVTDKNGNQRWNWMSTDPWGLMPPDTNPSGQGTFVFNLRFPGQYADAESGLFYNYHRYYDPSRGYTQSDPIGLAGGSYSLYAYVNGNPASGRDPLGLANGMAPNMMVRNATPATPGERDFALGAATTVAVLGVGAATGTLPLAALGLDILALSDGMPAGSKSCVCSSVAGSEMKRVGRWMSRTEYDLTRSTGRVQQGAGGSTSVADSGPASFFRQAPSGSVYVEFTVPKSCLLKGGQDDWFKIIGPDAPNSMKFMLEKQGGQQLPSVSDLSYIQATKP